MAKKFLSIVLAASLAASGTTAIFADTLEATVKPSTVTAAGSSGASSGGGGTLVTKYDKELTYGDEAFTLDVAEGAKLTSEDTDVISIGEDNVISVVGVGTAKITATLAKTEGEDQESAEPETFYIKVSPKKVAPAAEIKVYDKKQDGTNKAAIASAFVPVEGAQGTDEVYISTAAAEAEFASAEAGENIDVTINGLELAGKDADKYTLGGTQVSAKADIKDELTAEMVAKDIDSIYLPKNADKLTVNLPEGFSAKIKSTSDASVIAEDMSVKAKYFDTDVNIVLTISKDAAPAPSTEPTAEPTAEPTVEPSAEPTTEPEPSPSNAPAEEGEETYALEDAPEASSTPAATTEPTAEPSPSAEPTAEPTTEPTSEPVVESADTAEITVKVFGNGIKTGEKVTITTAKSGGSGTVTGGGEYEIGDVVILTAEGRFGYWIIDGKKYSEENPLRYTATKDETITAHFYKKGGGSLNSNYTYHTVRFDSNGGTNISDIKVANNTVAKQPEDPKRSGYEFTGWYSDKELKTRYTFKDRVFESMTLYAGWEKVGGSSESALPFTDVKESDWYYRAVEVMYNNDIMQGMTATRFEPNTKLTRAMFVTVLYRAEGEPSSNAKSGFGDVASNAWYAKAVAWAVKNNIVSGYDDDTFAPNDEITREQMAAIIYRYAKYTGYDMNGAADIKGFKDYADVSDWALAAVKWAVDIDILSGMDNNTLQPKGSATRAQCASILMRCSETLKLMDIETEE